MKKTIRLTESDLEKIIKQVLSESYNDLGLDKKFDDMVEYYQDIVRNFLNLILQLQELNRDPKTSKDDLIHLAATIVTKSNDIGAETELLRKYLRDILHR